MRVGKERHPDRPYENSRVRAINNDARSFLRQATGQYDLIVYGLLDSHTLLSHGSSVRLDPFVYTIEGLREARNRLKPDGMISLSFTVLSDALGRTIFLMLQGVFDGRAPLCLRSSGDNTTFLISNDEHWQPPASLMSTKFEDVTAKYSNSTEAATVSTDDWPFFYMPQRIYPASYLIMIALILLLSLLLVGNFVGEAPRFSHLSYSTLLSVERHISGIMAINLMGAIVGGLLEYNSMYLGFQALYLMAMLCYVLAFVADWMFMHKDASVAANPWRDAQPGPRGK